MDRMRPKRLDLGHDQGHVVWTTRWAEKMSNVRSTVSYTALSVHETILTSQTLYFKKNNNNKYKKPIKSLKTFTNRRSARRQTNTTDESNKEVGSMQVIFQCNENFPKPSLQDDTLI